MPGKRTAPRWDTCAGAAITEVAAMVNEETRRKLRELNLGEAVAGLEMQQSEPATIGLSFDERLQRLVDYGSTD